MVPSSLLDLERSFHTFMSTHGHRQVPGHPLRSPTPEVLFTTSGMHQLGDYLRGSP